VLAATHYPEHSLPVRATFGIIPIQAEFPDKHHILPLESTLRLTPELRKLAPLIASYDQPDLIPRSKALLESVPARLGCWNPHGTPFSFYCVSFTRFRPTTLSVVTTLAEWPLKALDWSRKPVHDPRHGSWYRRLKSFPLPRRS
jgi:hypothetical protein